MNTAKVMPAWWGNIHTNDEDGSEFIRIVFKNITINGEATDQDGVLKVNAKGVGEKVFEAYKQAITAAAKAQGKLAALGNGGEGKGVCLSRWLFGCEFGYACDPEKREQKKGEKKGEGTGPIELYLPDTGMVYRPKPPAPAEMTDMPE